MRAFSSRLLLIFSAVPASKPARTLRSSRLLGIGLLLLCAGSACKSPRSDPSGGPDDGSVAAPDAMLPSDDEHPPGPVAAASPWRVNSPDNRLVVEIAAESGTGRLSYRIDYDGQHVVEPTRIALATAGVDLSGGLAFVEGATHVIAQSYGIPTGKRSTYVDHANELALTFEKSGKRLQLVVRAYDDGGAYRWALPAGGDVTVNSETGGFKLPSGTVGWAADFTADYQGKWDAQTASQLDHGELEFPVLVKVASNRWALLSEASVYSSYFGAHLSGSRAGDGLLRLQPGESDVQVKTPFVSPWRLAIVGDSLADIVASTLVENLNPPSEITDTSWIKPGRSAWSWWSGDSTSSYDTQVRYVDFAASMGWEYYLCDEGWQASWMPQLVDYARSKGVGIWLWIDGDHMNTDAKIAANLALWSSWGIKGIKVDYVFGDSTSELAVYDKVALAAAQKHIMVNYHGCTKPSGERRRWPHLMTREAIYGAEQYKGNNGPTAKFNCIVPFTRNVVGPMDYTPVTYSDNDGQTTAAHQTALDVVFESGVQHLADKPSSYQNNVAKDFLEECPSAWDETRLVEGEPGRFVTMARRSGVDWFVGAICADAPRTATIPLIFLADGPYVADIYRDGTSASQQVVEHRNVDKTTVLAIPLLANGGCAIRVHRR